MSKLVFDAIRKYIHPTRCCQIIETESLNQLTSKEQRILSEDQKHSSAVAKVHYQKQRSREVAAKAHECLQKLQGTKGSEVDKEVNTRFGDSTSSFATLAENAELKRVVSPERDAPPSNQLRIQRSQRRVLKFAAYEDEFLKKGIAKHGFGQWTVILRDSEYTFQDFRTADSKEKGETQIFIGAMLLN